MLDIPAEIWIHIASYLPGEELRGLYSVNRVLFDASINARWKEVVLRTRNVAESTRIFKRLSDPFVAGRVRTFVLQYSQGPGESSIRHTDPHAFRMMASLKSLKSALHSRSRNPVPDFLHKVMAVTPHLVNVSHLNINCSGLPPKYDIRPLCKAFWKSFGRNLRCLTLGGNVESFRAIIESSPVLPALSELRLEFTDNIFRFREDADDPLPADHGVIMEVLAFFVNSLSPHLEGLRIWSWAMDLDMSTFFSGLTMFPKLQYFGVRMFFDNTLRDASGLRDILWNHSATLNRIELRLNSSRFQFQLNNDQDEPLGRFLLQCLADERCFSQALFLDIYPSTTSQGTEIILNTIKHISNTVINLTLRDRYLVEEEALLIIDAASECVHLKSLRMNLFKFSIGIMDRLASRLPNLEALWISAVESHDVTALGLEFTEALKTRCYDKWRLKDLSVWQSGADLDMDAMRMLGATIPSLESFFEGQTYL